MTRVFDTRRDLGNETFGIVLLIEGHSQTIVTSVFQESIRRSQHAWPEPNNIRVPRAYGDQSFHAQPKGRPRFKSIWRPEQP